MKNCFTAFACVLISLTMSVSMAAAAEKMQLPSNANMKQAPPPMKVEPQVATPQKSAPASIDINKTPAQPPKGQAISKPVPGSLPLFQGKVTDIKGNVITLTDTKGQTRIFEVDSAAVLKIGSDAWCEQDCRKQIRTANNVINVRRVLIGMSKSDQVEKAPGKTNGGGAKIRKKSRSEISGSEEEDLEGLEVQR